MDTNSPWIAIVDDDEAIRRALLRLMRAAGLRAQAFESGQALLGSLRDCAPPNCALLDVHMSMMSGLELQRHLAACAPDTGVVLMTGHHSAESEALARKQGALAYLRKPMDGQQLLALIAGTYETQRGAI